MDRIERALDLLIDDHVQFREEHKLLLAAQVVLTDRLDRLTIRVDKLAEQGARTDERLKELAELGAHTDERLNALIKVVDGLVRKQS